MDFDKKKHKMHKHNHKHKHIFRRRDPLTNKLENCQQKDVFFKNIWFLILLVTMYL